jgi:diguanylate cyclase (GGDEF)-like protein
MTNFADQDRARVLVIDDDAAVRNLLSQELSRLGYEVRAAADQNEAMDLLQRYGCDVVVSDDAGPGMVGADLVGMLQARDVDAAVIVGTDRASVEAAVDCLRRGAFDYLGKPYDVATLNERLQAAHHQRRQPGLDGLNAAAMALLQTTGIDDIVQLVVHHGNHLLGAEAAALVLGDPFSAEAAFHFHDDGCRLGEDLVAQLAQQTCQGGIAERLMASLSYGEGLSPAMAATEFHSALCYPLRVQDQYLGTLLWLRTGSRPDFDSHDLKLGALYSASLAQALETVRLVGKFQAQAVIDELTGLYSRRFLFETLWQLVKRLTRSNPPVLTCLGVGIDGVASLEAELGRAAVERLVIRVARLLSHTVRASDIVARSGPAEFLILLPVTDIPGGQLVAEKIRAAIAAEVVDPVSATVGIGIAGYDFSAKSSFVRSMKDASDLSGHLMQGAEAAMRQAQRGGRDQVATWNG